MKHNKTIKSYHKLTFLLTFGCCLWATPEAKADYKIMETLVVPDSIGNEIVNGQRYLIHKLSPQETYYQLGRIYNTPVKDIMDANNKKNLRIGDSVRIPRGAATVTKPKEIEKTPTPVVSTKNTKVLVNPQEITEYKVGKSETLYAISKRFGIAVEDIKKVNNLTSDSVREGQLLKIPNAPLTEPEPLVPELPVIIEEKQPIDDSVFKPTSKYGIREKKERGVGVWMDNFGGDGQTSLALHKSAPIGTILKITNPMNRSVTFAKVVGKFGDNQDTQDAIVVLSKSVATSIGALDRRFQIEITYGEPLD